MTTTTSGGDCGNGQNHGCGCGCSCGCHGHHHNQEGTSGCHAGEPLTISQEELSFLKELKQYLYLPVCCFTVYSTKEAHARFTALAPVYLETAEDDMEKVRTRGKVLSGLEKKGLISLDYDIPLDGFDYSMYTESELYRFFMDTVREGMVRPEHLCDAGEIELGSLAITELGAAVVTE